MVVLEEEDFSYERGTPGMVKNLIQMVHASRRRTLHSGLGCEAPLHSGIRGGGSKEFWLKSRELLGNG